MSLILVGTNYRYSSLNEREGLFFSPKDAKEAISQLLQKDIVKGCIILSTCQRIEIYAEADEPLPLESFFLHPRPKTAPFMARMDSWPASSIQLSGPKEPSRLRRGVDSIKFKGHNENLKRCLYVKQDKDAVFHLFRVAAGLDSLIIGENEILHQVKEAYLKARSFEATTPLINKLFERALFVGKLARSQTGIARRNPSIALEAICLAERLSGKLDNKNIFIIGAGTIAESIISASSRKKAKTVIVANRTFEKAKALALEFGVEAMHLREFPQHLDRIDLLFSATSSPHFIVTSDAFLRNRKAEKKLLIFDLALPRDIDPLIGNLKGISLFNLDDLNKSASPSDKEIFLAEEIVREKAKRFMEKEEKYESFDWGTAEQFSLKAG